MIFTPKNYTKNSMGQFLSIQAYHDPIRDDGSMFQMRCTICNHIERRNKLLTLKFDTFQKHVNHPKKKVEHTYRMVFA
jgi:hypothetical protein